MSTLKIGVHVLPIDKKSENETVGVVLDSSSSQMVEAELLDISPRLCRLRIPRARFFFDPREVRIQFAWTEVVARVIWTNTSDDYIELGLLLPDLDEPL